jgi:hypothetical protein
MTFESLENDTFKALTPKQLSELGKAIEGAIRQDDLERFLLYKLEEELRNISRQDTYPNVIFNLVKWARDHSKLRDLVIAASIENPGNPELRDFVEQHLQLLLELDSNPISSESLSSLIQLLKSINDFDGIILSASAQTLPDLDINHPDLRKQLVSNELIPAVKWLVLLELFLKRYGSNVDGQLHIVTFIQNLEILIDGASKTALTRWLHDLPGELQPAAPESSTAHQARPSDAALRNPQVHFVITVEPPEITAQTEQYSVTGYLIIRLGDDEQFTQFHVLSLSPPLSTDSDEATVSRQQTKAIFCTLQQIEKCLPDWLLQAQTAIHTQCTELQRTYQLEFRPVYDLTVEFWVPFEHLTVDADTWKIYGKPVRFKRPGLLVGQEYRVVVRSYDRFDDPDALNELTRTWQAIESLSLSSSDTPTGSRNVHHLDSWPRWAALRQQVQQQQQQVCLGLSLTCPLCLQEHKSQREDLFAWILEKGIPIALWSRCPDLADTRKAGLQQKMQTMLTTDILSQLDQLLENLKQTRNSAPEDQLTLWCDEPKRLIGLKQFRERGRLGA